MNITPVRIYINGNGSISFYGPNNTLITNLQNLNGAKQSNGQIIFDGDDKTISFYVYQLTSIESATFTLPYSALDSRFFNPSVYSAKLNQVYQDVAEYVLVNKNGGASFVGGVVAVYPNFASFPATGQEAVIYIDEGTNQAYFWDGTSYQLLVSTGVQQYATFALFPVTGSANVIYIDMSTFESYVWDGTAYEPLTVDTTGFVPYTGATTNVDLGEFELKAGQLSLDTSPTGTAVVGTTQWNNSIGSSQTTLKGGSVVLKNGVDLVARVVNKVTPNTTLTKAAYQAVRVSGAAGQRLAVEFAQANNDANSADTIGLVTETIATNQEGFIMTVGNLEEINTTGSLQGETWADGDVLYLSPTTEGALTNIKPNGSTGHIVVMGYVEYAHAIHGKIYVKIMNGWELDELHNVFIDTPTTWQVLRYDATAGYWTNSSLTASIIPSGIDASKIGAGTVDNTEFGYLNGVTSSIQTQLDGKVPETRTLTINGTTQDLSADRTFTIATGLTVGSTAIASGTVGRVLFEGTGNVLQEDSGLSWNNSAKALNIISASTSSTPFVRLTSNATTDLGGVLIEAPSVIGAWPLLRVTAGGVTAFQVDGARTTTIQSAATASTATALSVPFGRVAFESDVASGSVPLLSLKNNGAFGTVAKIDTGASFATGWILLDVLRNGTSQFTILAGGNTLVKTGNVLIGTTTDAGYKLDVNGSTRVKGAGATGATTAFIVQNSSSSDLLKISNDGYITVNYLDSIVYIASSNILMRTASGLTLSSNTNSALAKLFANGNFAIGTTTDAGYKLDVNGTARIVGQLNTSSNIVIAQGAGASSQFYQNLNNVFQFGIETVFIASNTAHAASSTSGNKRVFLDTITFSPTSGTALYTSFAVNPTINQTGGANGITRGLYINPTLTAAADFRAIEVASGITILGAATTAKASLRIPSGTAPTSPVNGDIWFDGTNIKMQIGGVTKTFTLT